MFWIANVNPSAFGLVSWKEKSLVNDCTFTSVVKKALLASLVPPSVSRSREALWFQLAFPLNCSPVAVLNPPPKLMVAGGAGFTIHVAVLLVTGPAALLTTT